MPQLQNRAWDTYTLLCSDVFITDYSSLIFFIVATFSCSLHRIFRYNQQVFISQSLELANTVCRCLSICVFDLCVLSGIPEFVIDVDVEAKLTKESARICSKLPCYMGFKY